jgi:hypothetical protein
LALVAPLDDVLSLSEPVVAACWLAVVCSTCDFFALDPCPESVELLDSYSLCWLYSSASCRELNVFFSGDCSSTFFNGDSVKTCDWVFFETLNSWLLVVKAVLAMLLSILLLASGF